MGNKTKKILIIVLSVMLVGVVGAMGAIFGRNDWAKIKDKVNDLTQQEEVVKTNNLIYNADFSINATDISTYTNENQSNGDDFLLDGWYLMHQDCDAYSTTIVNDGLYIKVGEDATVHLDIAQKVMDSAELLGNTLTLSFSLDNIVYSKTFDLSLTDTDYRFAESDLIATITRHRGSHATFCFQLQAGFEGVINWVQLEYGNVFTGFLQGPASYTEPVIS